MLRMFSCFLLLMTQTQFGGFRLFELLMYTKPWDLHPPLFEVSVNTLESRGVELEKATFPRKRTAGFSQKAGWFYVAFSSIFRWTAVRFRGVYRMEPNWGAVSLV